MNPDRSTCGRVPWLDLSGAPSVTATGRRVRLSRFSEPPRHVPEHVSPVHVLCLNTGGTTRLESTIAGRRSDGRSRPGDIGLYPAGVPMTFRWHDAASFLQIHLEPDYLDRIAVELHGVGSASLVPRETVDDELLAQLVRSLCRSGSIGTSGADRYTDALTDALATHLVHRYSDVAVAPRARVGGSSERRHRRVVEHIDAHLDRRLSVEELAAVACCSTAHFSRVFRARTGLSPHRFLLERRLARARELLVRTETSIADIALLVGFASQSHLTRHFTRHVGLPPARFRRERQSGTSFGV